MDLSKAISLESIILLKTDFNRIPAISIVDQSLLSQSIEIDVNHSDLKEVKFAVNLTVDYTFKYEETEIVRIHIQQTGTFITGEKVEDAIKKDFANVNAPAIIFPFVREQIASLCSKAALGNVLIQPVNFIELYKKKKEELDKK